MTQAKREGDSGLGWCQFETEACFPTNKHIFGAHLKSGLSVKAFSSEMFFFFANNRNVAIPLKTPLVCLRQRGKATKNANLICDN